MSLPRLGRRHEVPQTVSETGKKPAPVAAEAPPGIEPNRAPPDHGDRQDYGRNPAQEREAPRDQNAHANFTAFAQRAQGLFEFTDRAQETTVAALAAFRERHRPHFKQLEATVGKG